MANPYEQLLSSISTDPFVLIKRHLENFITRYGVHINFHDICGISYIHPQLEAIFSPYLYHNNSFCNFIKKAENCFKRCGGNKQKLFYYCSKQTQPFYGQCYMGIEEFVFPVRYDDKLIAMFCIGLFSSDIEKNLDTLGKAADEMNLDPQQCIEIYLNVVKSVDFPVLEMSYDLLLICNYISNLYKNHIENIQLSSEFQHDNVIQRTIDFIRKNYNRDLSLELLAANCYCNPSYLSHIFKQKMKMGIIDYVHQVRVDQAKNLLDITNYSITEIATLIGFQDSGYFTRVFKRITGFTPSTYKLRKN